MQSIENVIRAIPGGDTIADKLFGELTQAEKNQRELVKLREEIVEQQQELTAGDTRDFAFNKREDIIAEKEKRIAEIQLEEKERLDLLKQLQNNQSDAAGQMNENNIQQQLRGGGPPNMQIINAPQSVQSTPTSNNYSTPAVTIVNTDPIVAGAMN